MENVYEIVIKKDQLPQLSLHELLETVNKINKNLCWKLLWMEAVTNKPNFDLLKLENQINGSPNGIEYSLDQLFELSNSFNDIINILVIADPISSNLKRYNNDSDMYQACSLCLEFVDSSFWVIHTKNKEIDNLYR